MQERPIEQAMLEAIVDRLLDKHPLPWKVDQDWLPEVVAKDGAMIATSISERALAEKIVAYAEARHAERQRAMANVFDDIDKLLETTMPAP